MLAITLVALALAPLASRLVARIGEQISSELYPGPDAEGAEQEEIRQLIEARAFVRGDPVPDIEQEVARLNDADLREEIRSMVLATNESRGRRGERPFDVELETARRLAKYLGQN